MSTIVISGATGFLGSHLARRFVHNGDRIIALVRSQSSLHRLSDLMDGMHYCNIDEEDLRAGLKAFKPIDAVIHTATDYGRPRRDHSSLVATNVFWALRLLEAANDAGARCFINAGSSLPPEVSSYALSKSQFSQWGERLATVLGLPFVDVVLEHMYGENDDIAKFVTFVIVNCLRNVEHLPLTAGDQERDFIYIEDVVSGFVQLTYEFTCKPTTISSDGYYRYPMGSGKSVSIRQLAQMIHQETGSQTVLDFGALPYRPHEIMRAQAEISALNRLGWSPRFDLQEGIARTIDWYKNHWREYKACAG